MVISLFFFPLYSGRIKPKVHRNHPTYYCLQKRKCTHTVCGCSQPNTDHTMSFLYFCYTAAIIYTPGRPTQCAFLFQSAGAYERGLQCSTVGSVKTSWTGQTLCCPQPMRNMKESRLSVSKICYFVRIYNTWHVSGCHCSNLM